MKRKIGVLTLYLALIAMPLIITYAISSSQPDQALENGIDVGEQGLWFNSARDTVHEPTLFFGSRIIPNSFSDFNLSHKENHQHTVVIVGEVVGSSVNRIVTPARHLQDPNLTGMNNHVVTPILIHHIIHLGEDVTDLQIGQIANVIEGYFYVTSETQEYFDGVPVGDIVVSTFGAWPMEAGNRYILFGHYVDGERWLFEGEPVLSVAGREAVYLLNPGNPSRARAIDPIHTHYAQWWQDAMNMYGHLYDLPWVTPIDPDPEEPENPEEPIISTHAITFHSGDQGTFTNNETTITKEIASGSNITQVPNPQPPFGWEFVGWHYDGARWPISTDDVMALQITEDITLTAQYDILFYGQIIEVILEGITDFSIRGPGGDDVYRQHMTIYRETMTDHIPTKVGEIKSIITDNDVPGYHILLDENFFYIFEDMIFVDAGTIHSVTVVSSSGWTDYYENFLNEQDPWQNEIALFVSNRESMLSEWGIGWMRTVDDRLGFEVLTSSREENGSLEQIHSLELEVGLSE